MQVKATTARSVEIRAEPEHRIVFTIHRDGTADEVLNGPGPLARSNAECMQQNGQRSTGTAKLKIDHRENYPDGV